MAHKHKPHAIMIPIPHQGHINPFVHLALKLASNGFVITFINLEFVHQMLSKSHSNKTTDDFDLFFEARKLGLDIRYKTISDGLPLNFDRDRYILEFWDIMAQHFSTRIDELIGKIIESDPNLNHFFVIDTIYSWPIEIADTVYSWPGEIAKKYNLVYVSFWTEAALILSLVYHSDLLEDNGHFPCKGNIEEEITYIPGVESIRTKDLMPYLKESNIPTTSHKSWPSRFKDMNKADFILHNTVQELEFETLVALNKYQPNYAIGPINFSQNLATNTVNKSLWSESDCTHWLNSKPPSSVLYIAFGSIVHLSKHIVAEIAYGLLLSEVNFIWVVRSGASGSTDDKVLPHEFEDEVKDKGLIIPWCDQTKVLSNPTVAGFLTHCGWNSILESIWCGTPMICHPIDFDQPTNRKLVVDDWNIGINLCDGNSVTRKEVAEKIKKLMNGPNLEGFNKNIMQVREKLHNAVKIDGSSERNFNKFIKDLNEKIDAKVKTA